MKHFVLTLLVAFIAGCATVDFQPYEGNSSVIQGEGGTKVVTDGIDFWSNGTPPRKYRLIGVITSEVAAGIGDEGIVRSAVATEVKKQRGDAAIQMDSNTTQTGVMRVGPNYFAGTSTKSIKFSILKYID